MVHYVICVIKKYLTKNVYAREYILYIMLVSRNS